MNTTALDSKCISRAVAKRNDTPVPSWIGAVKRYFETRRRRKIDRQAFAHMLALDEATLRDIGISRADVKWASKLPLSENASLELQKLSLQNRGN